MRRLPLSGDEGWFEKQTGLANVVGKTVRELAPTHEQHWLDIYGRVAGTSGNLQEYRRSGLTAVQSTPIISQRGKIVGMISTHWAQRYEPSERELAQLDVLARQAADVIERTHTPEALRMGKANDPAAME